MFKASDTFKRIQEATYMVMACRHQDQMTTIKKGEVFMTLRDGKTGAIQSDRQLQEDSHVI